MFFPYHSRKNVLANNVIFFIVRSDILILTLWYFYVIIMVTITIIFIYLIFKFKNPLIYNLAKF
jgi:hypothetical protein